MEEFIEQFYTIFDDTDFDDLKPETVLKDLDEWSSLHALAAMTLIEQIYGRTISTDEMKAVKTIQDLYNLAHS